MENFAHQLAPLSPKSQTRIVPYFKTKGRRNFLRPLLSIALRYSLSGWFKPYLVPQR